MKKYILFAWDIENGANGGLGDVCGSFDTIEEAKDLAAKQRFDVQEIVDRDTWNIIWTNGTEH